MSRENKWWKENIDTDISEVIISLRCKLSGKTVDRDWTQDLSLDYEFIDDDLERSPSILAFWSAVLAEARRQKAMHEIKIDIRRSKVLEEIKENLREGVKLTVDDRNNIVNVDKEYQKLQIQLIDIDATVSKLFGIVESLKIKCENLRSMASTKRAELHNS